MEYLKKEKGKRMKRGTHLVFFVFLENDWSIEIGTNCRNCMQCSDCKSGMDSCSCSEGSVFWDWHKQLLLLGGISFLGLAQTAALTRRDCCDFKLFIWIHTELTQF